jgi:hypothetical protein
MLRFEESATMYIQNIVKDHLYFKNIIRLD